LNNKLILEKNCLQKAQESRTKLMRDITNYI
jgi:hypothetical protein